MFINKSVFHVSDAASLLCCSSQVIYELIHNGKLFAYKDGKAWKIPEKSINDYINARIIKSNDCT